MGTVRKCHGADFGRVTSPRGFHTLQLFREARGTHRARRARLAAEGRLYFSIIPIARGTRVPGPTRLSRDTHVAERGPRGKGATGIRFREPTVQSKSGP